MDTSGSHYPKKLSYEQIHYIQILLHLLSMNIPYETYSDYAFGRKFLDCFGYEDENKNNRKAMSVKQALFQMFEGYLDDYQVAKQASITVKQVWFAKQLFEQYYTKDLPQDISLHDPEEMAWRLEEERAHAEPDGFAY